MAPVSEAYDEQFQGGRLEQKILIVPAEVAEAGDLLSPDADHVETRRQEGKQLTHPLYTLHRLSAGAAVAWPGHRRQAPGCHAIAIAILETTKQTET